MSRTVESSSKNTPSVSRRQALKAGGAAAAVSLAGMGLPWVHAGEDNTIRLALIGCGGRGRGAVGNALGVAGEPIQLHAIADLDENRVSTACDVLHRHFPDRVDVPAERRFSGFDAYRHAIDCLRPGDIALEASYAYCRPLHVEYAVQKGVHLFMEKTFAADPAGCHRILAAGQQAQERNLKIAAGLQCRHSVARQAMIEKVRAGELGDIPLVRATRDCGSNYLAKPPADVDHVAWQIARGVHFLWARSGILLELLIHQIDECCWVMDGWPISATGRGTTSDRPDNCSQNMGDYSIEYTFANGGKAVVEGVSPFATFIHGTRRAAQFSGDVHRATVHTYKGTELDNNQIDWAAPAEPTNPWQAQWNNFVAAIRQDQPFNEAQRAIEANLASIMGRAAAHMGRTITWQQMLDSNFAFSPLVDQLQFGGPAPVQPDAEGNFPVPIPGKWIEI
jgi:predicted dehydrogenase